MSHNPNHVRIEELVDEYSDMLYSFALSRVNDPPLAKDMVQETFIKAYQNRQKLEGISSIKSWLFKVLKNGIIDHYRSVASRMDRKTVELDYSVYFDQAYRWQEDKVPSDWLSTFDRQKEEEFIRMNKLLRHCIKTLKEMPAAVIKMKYLEEMDSKDICKALDITSSNYWVIVHRAKLSLRSCIEKSFK